MSGKNSRRAARNFQVRLGKLNPAETVIVGIGNVLKGDDGAGPRVCQILKDEISTEVIDAGSTPENYIAKIVQMLPKKLLIIDAIDFGSPPGTVRIFDIQDLDKFSFSTHCLSPHLFVEVIQSEIDADVIFIGIQPAHLQFGCGLSKQVAGASAALADEIKLAISQSGRPRD
ncbi:MAG: hydrogenase 3 maturation endopeptidase HyCI [Sedimentisphaerales bacterium]|nr:hydrogenase 3 maturation endopeptidase HyCI [Sedimentisphaerales bacterium]